MKVPRSGFNSVSSCEYCFWFYSPNCSSFVSLWLGVSLSHTVHNIWSLLLGKYTHFFSYVLQQLVGLWRPFLYFGDDLNLIGSTYSDWVIDVAPQLHTCTPTGCILHEPFSKITPQKPWCLCAHQTWHFLQLLLNCIIKRHVGNWKQFPQTPWINIRQLKFLFGQKIILPVLPKCRKQWLRDNVLNYNTGRSVDVIHNISDNLSKKVHHLLLAVTHYFLYFIHIWNFTLWMPMLVSPSFGRSTTR